MSRVRTGVRRIFSTRLVAAGVLLIVAACANRQMEPARKIIADIETTVVDSGAEPAQYTPDALQEVNEQDAIGGCSTNSSRPRTRSPRTVKGRLSARTATDAAAGML